MAQAASQTALNEGDAVLAPFPGSHIRALGTVAGFSIMGGAKCDVLVRFDGTDELVWCGWQSVEAA